VGYARTSSSGKGYDDDIPQTRHGLQPGEDAARSFFACAGERSHAYLEELLPDVFAFELERLRDDDGLSLSSVLFGTCLREKSYICNIQEREHYTDGDNGGECGTFELLTWLVNLRQNVIRLVESAVLQM
jgi:hypothetical protein